MTFTYSLSPANDITRVRFHTGDTDSATATFSDEEITFMISENGDWKHAVVACLESAIARMAATPNFSADWLSVNNNSGLQYFTQLAARKRAEFGIFGVLATTSYTWRPDSRQNAPPTFDNDGTDGQDVNFVDVDDD